MVTKVRDLVSMVGLDAERRTSEVFINQEFLMVCSDD